MDENVIEDDSDSMSERSDTEEAKENNGLLIKTQGTDSFGTNEKHTHLKNLGRPPTALRMQQSTTSKYGKKDNNIGVGNADNESMFSAEYLDQSEKFVQAVINICEAQDIIPRVFNIRVHVAVGLAVLCCTFAVIPTAFRLAFGSDCAAWSD
eukprot:UN00860